MPLAAAVVGAAVIGGAASISASNKAANAAKSAATSNNALQQNIYNQNKDTLQPFVNTGTNATRSIEGLLGIGGDPSASASAFDAYKGSTEYASRLAEGQKQVTAALGAKGLLDSGAAQKSLLKYGQTFASNEFGNYVGNLQTQQQTGVQAAGALAGVGQNYAGAVGANNASAANTSGNAALASAGAINGVLSNALSAYAYGKGQGSSYGGTPQVQGGASGGVFGSSRYPMFG